jgi:hypothetical protein
MDAGVPIKAPVAGISCGLITKPDSDEFLTMVDIQGVEDFYGDMDFKVAGTKKGITAIQMDIKVDGLTYDIIKEAFHPTDVQPNDHPFEDVYRNNLLSLYDKLPLALINEEILYFNLEDPKSKALMEKLDRIIISRMQGFNIKQIALHVTYDGDLVSGFVGCVKYDNEKLNLDQLKLCVKELEKIYSKNKNII